MKSKILAKILEIEGVLKNYNKSDISLLAGSAGISIFYAQLFELTNEERYLEQCTHFAEYTSARLGRINISHTFCNGFTGIAWAIKYLTDLNIISQDDGDLLEDIDPAIISSAKYDLEQNTYDFLHGPIGAVVYALERLDKKPFKPFLEYFVGRISSMKEVDDDGFKWEDAVYPTVNHKYQDHKVYNLGIAHGMQSIIEILRRIYSMGICEEETSALIHGAINWILKQKIKNGTSTSIFPSCVSASELLNSQSSRLAWCYGDLSMGLLLWNCGETLKVEEWKEEAVKIMQHSLQRTDPFQNKYLDACVCHGTSGIAHLFKKFYISTRIDTFKERSEFWIDQTLEQARHMHGPAGYRLYSLKQKDETFYHRWKNSYGILEGIAGIGLVLISQLNDQTNWDRSLLLT